MASDGPKAKRAKTEKIVSAAQTSGAVKESLEVLKKVEVDRKYTASSILDFKLNKKRVRILSDVQLVPDWAEGIVYWMSRDQRVQDNWAMLYAQKLALKNEVPLHICFCLVPRFLEATIRHYQFLLKGLEEVAAECKELNMEFHLLHGEAAKVLPSFVTDHKMGAVVTDFSPLREASKWIKDLKSSLPKDVPLCQVDAHNIVPCWHASDKLEYGARTIRNKINSKLPEFLTQFPPVVKHPYSSKFVAQEIDWKAAEEMLEIDRSVAPVSWAKPGTKAGLRVLEQFCTSRLKLFGSKRNDPTVNALSNLSPWFHFGQISVQRCVLVVKEYKLHFSEAVNAFCEEAIIRRELADNFCFYNKKYDSIEGTNDWAKKTLNDHRKDKRQYLYTREELENAQTHDDLWNAAQIQLLKDGKMHGFLRMYWAKKILEWTESPEKALADAIYLNDRYSLDGRDPNGYVGCMWSICGIHDQGWAERAVFGKIRYMNYEGCKRKFDINRFICRWGGKKHKYVPKTKN